MKIATCLLIAAALLLAGCAETRTALNCTDRSLESESYQGPCWTKETFQRSREGGSEFVDGSRH
jgi:hypothetical protein